MAPLSWERLWPPISYRRSPNQPNRGRHRSRHDGGVEMSRYLVVTHQTALSPDLQRKVSALIAQDPSAEFAVLVPQTPGAPSTWEGETIDVAKQRAEAAKALLEENARAQVVHTAVGDQD